jgi:probable F420-dependent oxidoreductase
MQRAPEIEQRRRRRMKIGVGMPMIEEGGRLWGYGELRAFARRAEALGLDSIWVYDHLMYRRAAERIGIWEAWTLLAALAEATERVELGTLVLCTAFRNPALLAKMANDLDAIADGRLILGLGAGWLKDEFDAFGIPFDHKVDRFEEALQIICPLLRDGRVTFRGRYYSAIDVELSPRGPRQAGPPILIGAFGPRMLGITAAHADMWNTCWLGDPSALEVPRAALEHACAEAGRDPRSIDVTVGVAIAYPPGGDYSFAPADALAGTPEGIAAGLRGYRELGARHLICRFMPAPDEAALDLLGEALALYRAAVA